jgi:MFS family permease
VLIQGQDKSSFSTLDRRALFLMSIVAFFAGLAGTTISHTLPFARESLGLTEGDMFTVFAITRAASLAGIAFAIFADRNGRRKPFIAAYTLLIVGNAATAVLPGVPAFAIAQSVTRIGVVAVAALAVVVLAEELTPGIRAYGMGIYALAGSMGAGLGLILLPIAERSEASWRILFGISAAGLLALPLLNQFLRESRAFRHFDTHVTFPRALSAGLAKHFWPLAGIAFFVAAFSSPAFDFVFERLINDLAWDAGPARFLLIVFSGLGAFGLLFGGRMADSMGRRQTTVIAVLLGAVGGVAFYTLDSGWLLAPAILIASFGASMLVPAFAAHRSELFPTRVRATAAGWITNAAIAGSIAGFTVGALVVDSIGLSSTISILALGLVIAALLVTRLPETRGIDLVRSRTPRPRVVSEDTKPEQPAD